MCFRYAKITGQKVMKGFVLASDLWVSDPKMTKIDIFCIFSDNQTSGRIIMKTRLPQKDIFSNYYW